MIYLRAFMNSCLSCQKIQKCIKNIHNDYKWYIHTSFTSIVNRIYDMILYYRFHGRHNRGAGKYEILMSQNRDYHYEPYHNHVGVFMTTMPLIGCSRLHLRFISRPTCTVCLNQRTPTSLLKLLENEGIALINGDSMISNFTIFSIKLN